MDFAIPTELKQLSLFTNPRPSAQSSPLGAQPLSSLDWCTYGVQHVGRGAYYRSLFLVPVSTGIVCPTLQEGLHLSRGKPERTVGLSMMKLSPQSRGRPSRADLRTEHRVGVVVANGFRISQQQLVKLDPWIHCRKLVLTHLPLSGFNLTALSWLYLHHPA